MLQCTEALRSLMSSSGQCFMNVSRLTGICVIDDRVAPNDTAIVL